jgi:glutamate synthase domain-containing protein 3
MKTFDLEQQSVRDLNAHIHGAAQEQIVVNNAGGRHALAVGATSGHEISINGNVGYYCAGMNQKADITINGHAGPGLAENMMSGCIRVTGDASQYCAATAHGGLVVINGNASSRCGISMKGVNIVVKGNVGHMSAFMAQKGTLVVCGDAGDALGDSIYEATLYVRGTVASLGADCEEKTMEAEHREALQKLLDEAGIDDMDINDFTRYGSARKLYHFNIDNAGAY